MRRAFLVLCFLMAGVLGVFGKDLVRHNYRYNGYTRVRSERLLVRTSQGDKSPFFVSIEYIVFPQGEDAYVLRLDFESERRSDFAKGVKFTATTTDGKLISSSQMYKAPEAREAFTGENGKAVYWNTAEYLFESKDFMRLLEGVKSIDVAINWSPEGYIQRNFNGEFSAALHELNDAVRNASAPAEIGDNIEESSDNTGSKLILTKALEVPGAKGMYRLSMNYIYYKGTNKEDYDLTIELADRERVIPLGAKAVFRLKDGEAVELLQERDAYGVFFCYPDAEQIKSLSRGIEALEIVGEGFEYKDGLLSGEFSRVLYCLYNSLQSVSSI